MRRITTWITATLAVVAMISYYQVSLSGDGKHAEGEARQPVAGGCEGARPQTATTPQASTSRAESGDSSAGQKC
jgi:hypothetical protein